MERGRKRKKRPGQHEPGRCLKKGTLPPWILRVRFSTKKEPAMFITSQALTGPIAGYCVFSDMKNPLSKFLWTVDIWCTIFS